MAEQCERQAAAAESDRAREILFAVAATWRRLGDELKAEKIRSFPPPSS